MLTSEPLRKHEVQGIIDEIQYLGTRFGVFTCVRYAAMAYQKDRREIVANIRAHLRTK